MKKERQLYPFLPATIEDIPGIVEIEAKYFEKGVAYTYEFIYKWLQYNKNMFYVVKDKNNIVKGFTILVPITEECYQKLEREEINDMLQFDKKDILPYTEGTQSEYYYFADIAVSGDDRYAVVSIADGFQKFLCTNAHYVATTPLTTAGKMFCKRYGFGPEIVAGKNCFREVDEEIINKYGTGVNTKVKRIKRN